MPPTPTPDYLTCLVKFRASGLHLDFKLTDAAKFAAKIAGLPPFPSVSGAPIEHSWSVPVPLFNSDDNTIVLSHTRVTHMLFTSDDNNWWFFDPGFEPKSPAAVNRFQGIQILNNGAAVRVTFIPIGVIGEYFPYNLIMRTVVWQSGAKNGHATIIIDPVAETGSVGR